MAELGQEPEVVPLTICACACVRACVCVSAISEGLYKAVTLDECCRETALTRRETGGGLLRGRRSLTGLFPSPESQIIQPDWLSKRQHPGKREGDAEEGVEEEEEEGGAVGPHKRQHPGRREDVAAWSDVTQQKRQHPGRHPSWLGYTFTKRQHPGRRLVDSKAQGSWEAEEEEEEEEEGEPIPEKRQHPGKRALGGPCGPGGDCGQASLLLGLLDDLSRGRGAEEKRQHPGRRAAWAREPLEE